MYPKDTNPHHSGILFQYTTLGVVKNRSNPYLVIFSSFHFSSTCIAPFPLISKVHSRSFILNLSHSLLQNKFRLNAWKSKRVFGLIKLTISLGEEQGIWFIILLMKDKLLIFKWGLQFISTQCSSFLIFIKMWGWQLFNRVQKTRANKFASHELYIWGRKVVKKRKE